ncbi:hypothetical protein E2C01_030768 [Portunus trituberculatus]|uniref:Uncharacterized protein n=1 Tax=Portunus trituberculatus TaxID=210409 RepID=A0A5B7EY99_PORTR|nr:hypothetical protein [Portunus trituberculatus]
MTEPDTCTLCRLTLYSLPGKSFQHPTAGSVCVRDLHPPTKQDHSQPHVKRGIPTRHAQHKPWAAARLMNDGGNVLLCGPSPRIQSQEWELHSGRKQLWP